MIVAACVDLLEEVGRHGLSRAQIARRAGVSVPAVTRRFESVDDVLLAVARTPGREPGSSTTAAATSLREFLVLSLTASVQAFSQGRVRRPASELLAAVAGSPAIDEVFQATLIQVRDEGLTWIRRARESGEVRVDVDPEMILDAVTGAAYYRLLWRGQAIQEADVEPLVDLVLGGAAPRT